MLNSCLNKYPLENGDHTLTIIDYQIIGNEYQNNLLKRKIAEPFY